MKYTRTLILLLLATFAVANAQSDYEYVQNFKKEAASLKSEISDAKTLSKIGKIRQKINTFEKKYYARREFLNKAIYPQTFEGILTDFNNALDERSKMLSKLDEANAQIKKLNSYLEKLSQNYMAVLGELQEMKSNAEAEKDKLAEYKKRIEYLKKNIAERDSIISQTLSNLLAVSERGMSGGSENDITGKTLKIKDENVLKHLKRLISDNIEYLKYADVSSDEIFSIYNEQKKLNENLQRLNGENLKILLKNETAKADLTEVKMLNDAWGNEIKRKITSAIGKDFAQFGIELNDSSDVQTLYNSLLDYAEKESIKAGNQYERKHKFKTFSESAWNGVFKHKWLPGLLQNGLMTNEQVETVDLLVDDWGKRVEKSPPYALYILVSVIVMFITIYVAAKAKKSKYLRKAVAQKKKNEYDKAKREKEIEKYREKMKKKE